MKRKMGQLVDSLQEKFGEFADRCAKFARDVLSFKGYFGKVFALVSSIESLVPIVSQQAYASLWKVTSSLGEPWIGSAYFLSACIVVIPLTWAIYMLVRLKGMRISDLEKEPRVKDT